jgi:Short C-terminal domain
MGLLKTAATVAVASSVHGRIQRRQQARWAGQNQAPADPPAPPPPAQYPASAQQAYTEPVPPQAPAAPAPQAPAAPVPPANMNDRLAQLKQLGELLSAGVLTQAEFEQQKARILNG